MPADPIALYCRLAAARLAYRRGAITRSQLFALWSAATQAYRKKHHA